MVTEKTIRIPIYGYRVKIVVFDPEDREKIEKKYNMSLYVGTTLLGQGHCIVIIPSGDLSTAVHECEHAKNAVWEFIGYTPSHTNDEVDAYLLTYIFTEVNKEMQKHVST